MIKTITELRDICYELDSDTIVNDDRLNGMYYMLGSSMNSPEIFELQGMTHTDYVGNLSIKEQIIGSSTQTSVDIKWFVVHYKNIRILTPKQVTLLRL
jgi:hypothetical protein